MEEPMKTIGSELSWVTACLLTCLSSSCGGSPNTRDLLGPPGASSTVPGGGTSSGSGLGNIEVPSGTTGNGATVTGNGDTCGVTTHETQRLPPDVLLVLDRSGSMVENKAIGCVNRTCGTRWAEVTGALDKVLKSTQVGINWGLKYYPDDDYCGVNAGVNVAIKPSNADAVVSSYMAHLPAEGQSHTPTRQAVEEGAKYLKSLPHPNPKVILLATDGEPNCMVGWKDDTSAGKHDAAASVQAVADAAMLDVPVYVVGVATSKTDATLTLNQMAMAGGTARSDPALLYYAVDTSEDLETAMQAISAQVASCTFSLDSQPPVPDNVAVEADGTRFPRDATNGWEYGASPMTIELHGSACSKVKDGTLKSVKILFGCPDRPIN